MNTPTILALAASVGLLASAATPAAAQTASVGHTSVYTDTIEGIMARAATARANLPLISPRLLPTSALLRSNALPAGRSALTPGASLGSADGIHLLAPAVAPNAFGNFSPQSIAPYTTARASATVKGNTPDAASVAVTSYPWRATGKLYFNIGASQYVCTASMITPGLLLTAAHCVYEYGTNSASGWHTNFVWVPAQYESGAAAPYGKWSAVSERIPTPYYRGTDTCTTTGVVCNNDIAIIVMKASATGQLPGNAVGWYGYGWNGYSYVSSFGGASLSSITQLGYPVAFDGGLMMERTDGIGSYWTSGDLKNTVLGSAQTGGSSGGPWLVNFGAVPSVDTSRASLGNASNAQIVVGVTSWGYTTVGQNTQGASWFGQNKEYPNASYVDSNGIGRGAGNIGKLVADACSANADRC